MEVTLEQMLEAREKRAMRQIKAIRKFHLPIVSFSMNIAGPIKNTPLIRRGFDEGCLALEARLAPKCLLYKEIHTDVTGCEALYAVDMPPLQLKKITSDIEDFHGLGRLFDMDVLDQHLTKLDREQVGGQSRNCIVCGAAGRGCASRRLHSIDELQTATNQILMRYFKHEDCKTIGALASRSLMDEVCTTPKPGLVDLRNNGSHQDMNVFTFIASAASLEPYFIRCVEIGQETAHLSYKETFHLLRFAGIEAERDMFSATSGINTHKGAIFTMGLLCGAAGRLWSPECNYESAALLKMAGELSRPSLDDLNNSKRDTTGLQLYRTLGILGIRGQAAAGFPALSKIALPHYQALRAQGLSRNDAGAIVLLHLIANVEDTNMLSRGGTDGAQYGKDQARVLLEHSPTPTNDEICVVDDRFITRRLSPGGCADLLAAVYFLEALSK